VQASGPRGAIGLEGLRAVVADAPDDARGTADALAQAVLRHASGELDDDLAALVLRAAG
jgi:hypothetical protein